jgi:hypothetical protein
MTMAIAIETRGRRHYLLGNTYAIKDQLRDSGAKWDPDAKAWWTGKREIAEKFAGSGVAAEPSPGNERPAPGPDAAIVCSGRYKGRSYYVMGRVARGRSHWDDTVEAIQTRDGAKVLLAFRDGSRSFWAPRAEVTCGHAYRSGRGSTIGAMNEYIEQRRAEDKGEAECPVCARYCTCGKSFCHHHHDGCDRCGAEG